MDMLLMKRTLRWSHVTTVAYRRTLSSWTMVDIPGKWDVATTTTLYLREQYTSPPGVSQDTTGRRLWPTALPLLQWIRHQHQENSMTQPPTKPIVLELGAGCGLVGMGLAVSGTYGRVVLTDLSTEWLQLNVNKNRSQFSCPVDVLALQWGAKQDHDALQTYLTVTTTMLPENPSADSHQPSRASPTTLTESQSQSKDPGIMLDYIVGSDLLYNPSSHKDLVTTLGALASDTTRILLAVPQRLDNESSFRVMAEDYGFAVQVIPLPIPNPHDSFQKHVLMTLVKK